MVDHHVAMVHKLGVNCKDLTVLPEPWNHVFFEGQSSPNSRKIQVNVKYDNLPRYISICCLISYNHWWLHHEIVIRYSYLSIDHHVAMVHKFRVAPKKWEDEETHENSAGCLGDIDPLGIHWVSIGNIESYFQSKCHIYIIPGKKQYMSMVGSPL